MVIAQLGADEHAIRAMQQVLTNRTWDDAAILRRQWQEVAVDRDDAEGIRIVDGSDVPTHGTFANCQAGVLLAYASPHGTTLLDRRLYLPCAWVEDAAFAERRATGCIPADVTFQTKNALVLVQDGLARQALRCRWLLADAAFGRDTGLLDAIADLGLWYLGEVPLATAIWPVAATAMTTPQKQVGRVPTTAWMRHTLGNSTTGRRLTDAVVQRDGQPGPAVWPILRHDPATGEPSAFLSNAPPSVTPARLIAVSGMRWPIEPCCDVAKQDLGWATMTVARGRVGTVTCPW
ncbi:transposase [Chloroflexus sp.]|uniref:transposase n=1 Tax=Chloroflexus sp. TaxID=1904827 RepID=UPI00404934B2